MGFGKSFKRAVKKTKGAYSSVAGTRQGQVAIALASHSNPVSAAITERAPLAGATRSVFEAAKHSGAINSLLSPSARRAAGKTFGKYYVLGASKLTGGASDKALMAAGASGALNIAGLSDIVDGYTGSAPDDAPSDVAPVTAYDPAPVAGESAGDSFPLILIIGGGLVIGGLLLFIYLRK